MSRKNTELAAVERVEPLIREIRGERVILDADLARLYGVPTSRFNEAVKRNVERFPPDFRFQITGREAESLRSQSAILKTGRGQHRKYLPHAFTEHGAIMAANVLNSAQAVQMSVFVVRAFVKMRGMLMDTRALAKKLAALESELKSRLDVHEVAIVEILQRVMDVLNPPQEPEPPRRELGFHVKEEGDSDNKSDSRR
jgi:phage regulator Rha-like protein